jgi:hypothetical protein
MVNKKVEKKSLIWGAYLGSTPFAFLFLKGRASDKSRLQSAKSGSTHGSLSSE